MFRFKRFSIFILVSMASILIAGISSYPSFAEPAPVDSTSSTSDGAKTLDPNASISRVNRMTLKLGNFYFYDSKTTDSNWTFTGVGTGCEAKISYSPEVSGDASIPEKWTLTYKKQLETGGECGPENTKNLSKPSRWSERENVVLAGGAKDGKIISVKPDSDTSFTKKENKYNDNRITVYIQDNVDAYSCPLVIRDWANFYLIPLEKKNDEDSVSEQIRGIFNKELGVGDTFCGPTDNDELGIFSRFGLPEGYYDGGNEKDNYGKTDFGLDGEDVAGAKMTIPSIAEAGGIALNGPLKGGGYAGADGEGASGTDDGGSTTSCAIDGIGWIVCPVMVFLGKINDLAFGVVNDLLTVETDLYENGSATQNAWTKFRDIANVAFVIAFMFIIYSQVSSVGISNYGIKKLLPKLIIAALLVNLSYFICQILVDLSNVVGSASYEFLKGFASTSSGGASASGWDKVIASILLIGVGVGLIAAVILAPTVLIAVGAVVLILIARKAIIIVLIVISPLAFVAYLLPNTEDWFKKWWKMFYTLLLVFPVVAIIFGASTMVSNILMSVAGQPGEDQNNMLAIVALAAMGIPLFAVPAVLKGAIAAAGSIGTKVQGIADRRQAGATGGMKKRSGERLARTGKDIESRMATRKGVLGRVGNYRTRRDFRRKADEAAIDRRQQGALVDHVQDSVQSGSGRYDQFAHASAISQSHKMYDDEVSMFKQTLGSEKPDTLAAIAHNTNESEHKRVAAAGLIGQRGGQGDVNTMINKLGQSYNQAKSAYESADNEQAKQAAKSQMDAVSSMQKQFMNDGASKLPQSLTGASKGDLGTGQFGGSLESEILKSLNDGRFSGQSLASMHPSELKDVATTLQRARSNNQLNSTQLEQLANLKQSIGDYKKASVKQGRGMAEEVSTPISSIESILRD